MGGGGGGAQSFFWGAGWGGCGRSGGGDLSHSASAPCCPNPASWPTLSGIHPGVEEAQTAAKRRPVNPHPGTPPALSTA